MNGLNLATEPYVNLETYRKTGVAVKTPVWVALHNGAGYVFSAGDAGKIKRLRNNPAVSLAACDFRGNVHGPWVAGTACIVTDTAEISAAYAAFDLKYGLRMKLTNLLSRLTGRYARRAMIAISLTDEPSKGASTGSSTGTSTGTS